MVMESRPGPCPRCGTEIAFEVQYELNPDGSVIYKDCSCADLISCASYDETQCPWIWYNYFCTEFGIQPVSPEEAQAYAEAAAAEAGAATATAEGEAAPAEGEAVPAEGEPPPADGDVIPTESESPPAEDQPPAQ